MTDTFFGFHLMLDISGCNHEKISSKENIYNFSKNIVYMIDMIAHGEPIIEMMCIGDPKVGYSLVQLITTSNITAHFLEDNNTAFIDVFSCKEFDITVAEKVVREFFEPEKVRVNFITRHAD